MSNPGQQGEKSSTESVQWKDEMYSFSSLPRGVPAKSKKTQHSKFRLSYSDGAPCYGNIMYDRRVIRGNTYAQPIPSSEVMDPVLVQKKAEQQRRLAVKRRAEALIPRIATPEPAEGRMNLGMQTELYLEELTEVLETADVPAQTDYFLDRPPEPLFVATKAGLDKSCQVLPEELFNFDVEVKPILEVLVGKTVEMAKLEVCEEEELANLHAQIHAFEELRNAEVAEAQRLEEGQRRKQVEKEIRMKEQEEVLAKEKEVARKIAACAFGQCYIQDLLHSVFGTLFDAGYFFDTVERDVELGFLSNLIGNVEMEMERSYRGRVVLDGLLRDAIKERLIQEKAQEVTIRLEGAVSELKKIGKLLKILDTKLWKETSYQPVRVQFFLPEEMPPDSNH